MNPLKITLSIAAIAAAVLAAPHYDVTAPAASDVYSAPAPGYSAIPVPPVESTTVVDYSTEVPAESTPVEETTPAEETTVEDYTTEVPAESTPEESAPAEETTPEESAPGYSAVPVPSDEETTPEGTT
ncbi:hypothetical protein EV177_010610, partial [Coemansia sp. RSA 1804]